MANEHVEKPKTYVVEHLDPELGPWSTLEYLAIAQESSEAGARFCLSSLSAELTLPRDISSDAGILIEHRGVEEIYNECRDRVCLLDPAAKTELSPGDFEKFDVFLFGGILGTAGPRTPYGYTLLTIIQVTIRLEVRR